MSGKNPLRKHLFVDSKVQGALIHRVVIYWFLCLVTLVLMIIYWRMCIGPERLFSTKIDDLWFQYGPAVIGSLFILPLVIIDIVRLSNRFVGPLLRLRRLMRALARGQKVSPLHFREGDFWREFALEFNDVAARMQLLDRAPSSPDIDDDPLLAGTADLGGRERM